MTKLQEPVLINLVYLKQYPHMEPVSYTHLKINSFVTIDEEGALKKAAEVQAKIDAGELKSCLLYTSRCV